MTYTDEILKERHMWQRLVETLFMVDTDNGEPVFSHVDSKPIVDIDPELGKFIKEKIISNYAYCVDCDLYFKKGTNGDYHYDVPQCTVIDAIEVKHDSKNKM